ncbi:YtxH domain-containing protein [Brevibacterium sp. SMBL_HHYL_HB1]|uniref:YtxH domain-containing protein n=1 Tax=Brevibacterium sp. SMBL_HHYL_HB1 TaxID=2777556 RepID=UPI001BA8EA97|nr:YtxH domain-containing protein [Brevibacterium sp. SMBL_HHYL_HB1]QUL79155.1 YtxH domain-containing protein [Brevibacterium sp. SMBL_HHYL_HB1]
MKKRLILLAGLGVGYILGSRTGRQSYERLKAQAQDLWTDPRVQDTVEKANQSLRERSPAVADAMQTAAGAVQSAADKVNAAAEADAPASESDGDEDGTNAAPASADEAASAKPEHKPSPKARDAVGDPERHLDDEGPGGVADDD